MTPNRSIQWQSAKRDWAIRIGVAVFATLLTAFVGPFGSYDLQSFGERILYWGGMIFAFILPAVAIRALVIHFLPKANVARDIGVAVLQGLIIGPLAWMFSMAVTDLPVDSLRSAFEHIVFSTLIMLVPAGIRYHLRAARRVGAADALRGEAASNPETPVAPVAPDGPLRAEKLFLDRLEEDMRGAPLRVSAADHFLCVKTAHGESRIRMRFGDALRELKPFDGVCIHRSHWVALSQIDRTEVQGRRTILHLRDGEQLPVSATGVAALRKSGIAEL